VKNILELVKIGDGKLVYTTRVGWLRLFYTNQEGENTEFILEIIQYIPGFWNNLFSLTAAMSKSCSINNKDQMFVVAENGLQPYSKVSFSYMFIYKIPNSYL